MTFSLAVFALLDGCDHMNRGGRRRRGRRRILSSHDPFGIGEPVSHGCWRPRLLVILDGINNKRVFGPDLGQQDRDVSSVPDRTWRDSIQAIHQ